MERSKVRFIMDIINIGFIITMLAIAFSALISMKTLNRDPCGSCERVIGLKCDNVSIQVTLECQSNYTLCLPNSSRGYITSRIIQGGII